MRGLDQPYINLGDTDVATYINKQVTGASGTIDFDWPGGSGSLAILGTFAGAVFQLQLTLDNYTTVRDSPGAEVTIITDDVAVFEIGPCRMRLAWTGGNDGGTTSIRVLLTPCTPGWFNDPATLPATT
jgi:hypothetical protein